MSDEMSKEEEEKNDAEMEPSGCTSWRTDRGSAGSAASSTVRRVYHGRPSRLHAPVRDVISIDQHPADAVDDSDRNARWSMYRDGYQEHDRALGIR